MDAMTRTLTAYPSLCQIVARSAWGILAGYRDRLERERPVPEIDGLTYTGIRLHRAPLYIDPLAPSGLFYLRSDLDAMKRLPRRGTFDPLGEVAP